MPTTADHTIAAYRAAFATTDADAVTPLSVPEVVLHSPLTDRVPNSGRREVTELHRDLFAVLDRLRTNELLAGDTLYAFGFRAKIQTIELSAQVVTAIDHSGLIDDVSLFTRPLPALAALFGALPSRVAGRRQGRLAGTLALIGTKPFALAVDSTDRVAPRLLKQEDPS